MKKIYAYSWECYQDNDKHPWDVSNNWYATQENAYKDMLEAVQRKSTWACEWDDICDGFESPNGTENNGIVSSDSFCGFNAACYPDRIELDPGTGKYHYRIVACEISPLVGKCLAWITGEDGMEGAIGELYDYLWYQDIPNAAEEDRFWWEKFHEKWGELVPSRDQFVRDNKGKSYLLMAKELDECLKGHADKLNADIKAEYKAVMERAKPMRHFDVRISTQVDNIVEIQAASREDAIRLAKEKIVSGALGELPNGWFFAERLALDKDQDFLDVEYVDEEK